MYSSSVLRVIDEEFWVDISRSCQPVGEDNMEVDWQQSILRIKVGTYMYNYIPRHFINSIIISIDIPLCIHSIFMYLHPV